MRVDECRRNELNCYRTARPVGSNSQLNVNGPLQLGGLSFDPTALQNSMRWSTVPSIKNFHGCVANLSFNGEVKLNNKNAKVYWLFYGIHNITDFLFVNSYIIIAYQLRRTKLYYFKYHHVQFTSCSLSRNITRRWLQLYHYSSCLSFIPTYACPCDCLLSKAKKLRRS
jgi:laminin G domain protein